MDRQTPPLSSQDVSLASQDTKKQGGIAAPPSANPPTNRQSSFTNFSPFWQNRLLEGGLILSMALYYIVGNANLNIHISRVSHLNPLLSLPFLLIFAVLCWYRLSFAIALLPLALPYYLLQKEVLSIGTHKLDFSLVEIALWTCVAVALLQVLVQRKNWAYKLSFAELRERIGPFAVPILVFLAAAALSIIVAYARATALRAFREEILGPLVYLLLALYCLRSRQDVARLLYSLLGTAFIISVMALVQYVFFKNTLRLEPDGIRRVETVYGSANSIGLLLDYTLPIGFAWLLIYISWRNRIVAALVCLPILIALYLSQSHGAWVAIAVALCATVGFALRNRRLLLLGTVALLVFGLVIVIAFPRLVDFVLTGHTNTRGVSTVQRRFYLWESAWYMIRDYPWFGVGLDNWLCYYSKNTICDAHAYHYWIVSYAPNHVGDTGLRDEPNLSHPHNIFLHVWVSIGIFGLLAFVSVLVLFWRLFIRILLHLRTMYDEHSQLRWMTVAVGVAMLAALVQGQGDSAFLEQDLAFCFWMLITALLLLRSLSNTPWRGRVDSSEQKTQKISPLQARNVR